MSINSRSTSTKLRHSSRLGPFSTDSLDDFHANPLGTEVSFLASKPVFEFLGVPEKTGLHFRHGKHEQNDEDWTALLDFADWDLLKKSPAAEV